MPLITTFGAGSVRGLGRAARLVPPGAPTGFSATGRTRLDGAGGATVSFNAPLDNGGAPITDYQVQNISTGQIFSVSSGGVVSLSNNTEQTFRVRAVNAAGAGDWSSTDTAFAGYWSFQPGNGGGSTTFSSPAGISSFVYQVFSNGGASAKPDTRTYQTLYPSYVDWWGETIQYNPPIGLPYWWSHYRQYDGASWWTYDVNWNYMSGYISYAWGNISSGQTEYYYMYASNSGPWWSYGSHYGWYYVSGASQQVQSGGSPAQGPTSGTGSSISVPGWGSDSVGGGFGGTQYATSGTATVNPSSGTNVTVNIGYSNGDYAYSTPGYAIIAYGR